MNKPIREWLRPVKRAAESVVRRGTAALGYEVVPRQTAYPPDLGAEDRALYDAVRPFTLTSPERVFALCRSVDYIVSAGIPGAIVECGVWRGGSMMAACIELLRLGCINRDLFLYDTFDGMTAPDDSVDVDLTGKTASAFLSQAKENSHPIWDGNGCASAPMADVQDRLESTGYPAERMHLVAGRVEETIPGVVPESIALLRLDTDWYESTRHEMEHLFPRLVAGGVLLLDDYGHWKGSQKAVDEYFEAKGVRMLLNRVDYTARVGVVGTPASTDDG